MALSGAQQLLTLQTLNTVLGFLPLSLASYFICHVEPALHCASQLVKAMKNLPQSGCRETFHHAISQQLATIFFYSLPYTYTLKLKPGFYLLITGMARSLTSLALNRKEADTCHHAFFRPSFKKSKNEQKNCLFGSEIPTINRILM